MSDCEAVPTYTVCLPADQQAYHILGSCRYVTAAKTQAPARQMRKPTTQAHRKDDGARATSAPVPSWSWKHKPVDGDRGSIFYRIGESSLTS